MCQPEKSVCGLRHAAAEDTSFARLVSLACHDLRTPLATVHGFAKTMLRMEDLARRCGALPRDDRGRVRRARRAARRPRSSARIESGRYDPGLREADTLELAPERSSGTGATVNVDPDAVAGALGSLARAAARHGGVEVSTTVVGPRISIEPVVAAAAPVVLGEQQKDLGAAVAVRLLALRRGHRPRGRTPDRHASGLSLGDRAEHRDDPERGARGEERERPAPADRVHQDGISQIVATVSVKPTASCSVSAVPT